MKKKIIITGGTGRFGIYLRKLKTNHDLYFPGKKVFDILDFKKISKYINRIKPEVIIHLAGLSRPHVHNTMISKSIDLNIIGTANVTKACYEKYKIDLFFNKLCLSRNKWKL